MGKVSSENQGWGITDDNLIVEMSRDLSKQAFHLYIIILQQIKRVKENAYSQKRPPTDDTAELTFSYSDFKKYSVTPNGYKYSMKELKAKRYLVQTNKPVRGSKNNTYKIKKY